jgi:Bardet-Biedl syndrome 2 protein
MLNFNRKITSLAAGCLNDKGAVAYDLLLTGTQSNLLAYDVDRNSDVFFRDCPDGVNSIVTGKLSALSQPLVLTGGNCSVLGFDNSGNEAFWTVTSDNISSLGLCDIDNDGKMELLVGSDDFEIRIFRQEELIGEISEADRVTQLLSVGTGKFGYGLANGTVGVYNGAKSRMWRVKTKHKPVSVISYDINNDGVMEIISGWSNGSFNVRNSDNGEVLFRATLPSQVAGIVRADYRMDEKEQLMVCTDTGEVRGYVPADAEMVAAQLDNRFSMATLNNHQLDDSLDDKTVAPRSEDQKILDELQERKLELLNELKRLETSSTATQPKQATDSLANATLSYQFKIEPQGHLGLRVTSADSEIQVVNMIAIDTEGGNLEGSDVIVFSPSVLSNTAVMALKPSKNQNFELQLQVPTRINRLKRCKQL